MFVAYVFMEINRSKFEFLQESKVQAAKLRKDPAKELSYESDHV